MGFNIDLIIVFLFLVINFLVGFSFYKKSDTNDFKTYSIGNFKNPSIAFLTASLISSFISGAEFFTHMQQAYYKGFPYIFRGDIIFPLSFVITAFFVFSMHKNKNRKCLTLDQWAEERYNSSFLRALMGISEFLLSFGIFIIQFKTFGIIAKSLFNLPPEYEKLCVIGFAIFLSLYTFRRGFIAVALTDVLQFWVFIIALFSVIGFIAFKSNFFAGVWDKGVMENPKMSLAPCFEDYNATLFTLGLWFCSIFPKVNGPRYQRIMACDDAKKVKKSFLIASVILMVCTGCYTCISLLIYSQNPNLKMSEIVPFFVRNYCPTGLKGLLGAGLFAMSISTVESILNCNSVIFTNDILPYFSKMFSKKTYTPSVFVARCATVFFCFLGVLISLKFSDPFSILLVFSNFYYPVAMLPYVILVLNLNFNRASIFVGIFCGILGTIINYVLTKDVNSYTIGIFAHLVALLLTELIVRMKNKNNNSVTTID